MDLKLLDIRVILIREKRKKSSGQEEERDYVLLVDANGVPLKTADGFYLAVAKEA